MSKNKSEQSQVEIDKLDAIKEIIFGENIKAYDHEFKQLKDHINKLQADNKKMLEESESAFNEKIDSLKNTLKEDLAELRSNIESLSNSAASRTQVSTLLNEMADKLKQ